MTTGGLGLVTLAIASLVLLMVVGFRTRYAVPMLASYAAHGLLAALIYTDVGLYAPDARTYSDQATGLFQQWLGQPTSMPPLSHPGKEGFPLLLGGLYWAIGGVHPTAGLIVNVTACALLVPVVASTAERLGAPGKPAAWLAGFFPSILFWGSMLLREALSWLCIAVFVRALAGMQQRSRPPDVVAVAASLLALLWIRGTAAVLVGAAGLLVLVMTRRRMSTFAMGAVLVGLAVFGPLADRLSQITGTYDSVTTVNQARNELATTANSGFSVISYSDPGAVVHALPRVLPRALFGPFPWEWPALNPLEALDALAWLALLWATWRAWKRLDKRKAVLAVAPALTIAVALAVTSGNYGTMQRLRMMSAVMLFPVAAATARPRRGSSAVTPARSDLASQPLRRG